jgi:ergothioneine biosynthesis protein EgtB
MHRAELKPNPARAIAAEYSRIRQRSLDLAAPLAPEDTVVQSMPDVSPTKWHLAHTTWFFEEFVLSELPEYRCFDERWRFLFNSYYQSVGPMHARVDRGLLSRPTLAEVLAYRSRVDESMIDLLARDPGPAALARTELGLNHEQQHQELLLTDIKHVLSCNPLEPAYRTDLRAVTRPAPPQQFLPGANGVVESGADPGDGFVFDCETPRHRSYAYPHALARRPVTCGEYREFLRQGGYRDPAVWLSDGWSAVQSQGWTGPLYWDAHGETAFTLGGRREIDPEAPVCHVSYFEADAFARWSGARLPSEVEWECAARSYDPWSGEFADRAGLHPRAAEDTGAHLQMYGDVWEWTASPYVSYPGFQPLAGALGEYNGKFMCGQFVLRGGSCLTPQGHVRSTYRNFFYPRARWQMSGIRLARDAAA